MNISTRRNVRRMLTSAMAMAAAVTAWTQTAVDPHDWTIELVGARSDRLDRAAVVRARASEGHSVERRLESRGETHTYRGIPLRMVVAMVDGSDSEHPYTFDDALWESGYDITLEAADGYAATFSTADVPADELLIAETRDGEAISPMVVGEVSSRLWVKDLVRIELAVLPYEAAGPPAFELYLQVNDERYSFTLTGLQASPYYLEGPGSFTTSAGTTYTNEYGGVSFAELLEAYVRLEPGVPVTVVAMDGYEMTYEAAELMDTGSGVWILAFKMDGDYLPKDPGYVRTVKIGPEAPNISGHASVKMVAGVRVRADLVD